MDCTIIYENIAWIIKKGGAYTWKERISQKIENIKEYTVSEKEWVQKMVEMFWKEEEQEEEKNFQLNLLSQGLKEKYA